MDTQPVDTDKANPVKWQVCSNTTSMTLNPLLLKPIHSAVICEIELYKRNGIMKTRLATNVDVYPLRLVLFFE